MDRRCWPLISFSTPMIPYPCVLGLFTGVSRYRVSLAAYWSTAQFVFWLFNVLSILRCGGFRCWFIHAYLPLFRLTSIAPPYLCWSGTGKESGRMVFTDVDYKNQAWFYYLRSKNHPSAFCSHPPSPRLACICWVYSCGMVRMSGTASGWTPVGPAGGGRWELLVFCCIWLGLRARCAGIGTGKESGRMVFTS